MGLAQVILERELPIQVHPAQELEQQVINNKPTLVSLIALEAMK